MEEILGEEAANKVEEQKQVIENLQTNFKIYCSINKVQLTFQDENFSDAAQEIKALDFL